MYFSFTNLFNHLLNTYKKKKKFNIQNIPCKKDHSLSKEPPAFCLFWSHYPNFIWCPLVLYWQKQWKCVHSYFSHSFVALYYYLFSYFLDWQVYIAVHFLGVCFTILYILITSFYVFTVLLYSFKNNRPNLPVATEIFKMSS